MDDIAELTGSKDMNKGRSLMKEHTYLGSYSQIDEDCCEMRRASLTLVDSL